MQSLPLEILENKTTDILFLIGFLLFGLIFHRYLADNLSRILYRFIKHDKVPIHTCVEMLRKPVRLFISLIILYLAFSFVHFPKSWNISPQEVFGLRMFLIKCYEALLIYSIAWIFIRITKFIALIFQERAALTESKLDDQFVPFFRDLVIVIISFFTFFVMLGVVFRVDVVALVTGLGIGGLAIALAARETLENLFASFTLFLDLPFVIGDNIQLDKVSGDVEKIGFRSTRLRTGEGSVISIPNRLLTAQALENHTQRTFRKTKYLLKLHPETTLDKVQKVIQEINQFIHNQELVYNPDLSLTHFEGFGDNSIDISVAFYVSTHDAVIVRKLKETINYQIMEILDKNGVKFARPNVA
ncbi:MAG: mechanosensitive ion channel family protein [Arcicella sp.]|nr:mechanosensitive ion channel family protein [Arcicella sp.]